MTNFDHSEGRVTKNKSRRQANKAAEKSKRAQSSRVRDDVAAAMHNSRSASFDRILRRPGRGGLTAKGAEQLQKLFANKVPKTDKPKMGEMDSSAVMVLLQLAADEVEAGELTYESLRQVAEENLIGNGAEAREGAEEDAKAEEDRGMEEAMEVEESKWSLEEEEDKVEDEDWEQGGVVLANDL